MARKRQPKPVAYSYVRFSRPEQARGDSLRRQMELRDAWLKRSGAVLDTSLNLRDEGVSGFTGQHKANPDRHALAAFLELVKAGRIPRGSFLVVENLDRLSREHIQPALILFLNLLQAGVRVVQLIPAEAVYDDKSEAMAIMQAVMELSRGHSESSAKKERCGLAWGNKKRRAAADRKPITRVVPCWVEVRGDSFALKPEAAAVVRRIYRMATEGAGIDVITKTLNREGVPPIGGRSDRWAASAVGTFLKTRAVIGEYQPHKGNPKQGTPRVPDGPPIPNYFPAVITEQEWYAARACIEKRRRCPGRRGHTVGIFAGLLRDARDGAAIHRFNRTKSPPALASYSAMRGVPGAKFVSFPFRVFESAILSQLREVDPRSVLPEADGSADRVLELTGRLSDIEARIQALTASLDDSDEIPAVVAKLRKWNADRQAMADELAIAQQQAASPLAATWGAYRTLAEVIEKAPDQAEVRTRLRAVVRRMVSEVRCLFVAKGWLRMAAVQVWFEGGRHRDYLICFTPRHVFGKTVRDEWWRVESAAFAGTKGELDLRDPKQAAALEKVLGKLDPAEFGQQAATDGATARRRARP